MKEHGYSAAERLDVALANTKQRENLAREKYKILHPELVIWLDKDAYWRDYQSALKLK